MFHRLKVRPTSVLQQESSLILYADPDSDVETRRKQSAVTPPGKETEEDEETKQK